MSRYDSSAVYFNERMARFERPSGFVCVNDLVAQLLYKRLSQLGYVLGPDMELATVDDDHVAEANGIPMIRIAQEAYRIGTQSAEFLLARIAEPSRPVQQALLKAGTVANGAGTHKARSLHRRGKEVV